MNKKKIIHKFILNNEIRKRDILREYYCVNIIILGREGGGFNNLN